MSAIFFAYCAKAIASFGKYIASFPDGKYSLNAHFYRADCLYKQGQKAEACQDYLVVIARGKNDFTEESLVNSANYLYDSKNIQDALPLYKRLISESANEENRNIGQIGEMRCLSILGLEEEAIESENKVLSMNKLEPETEREAQFLKAKSYRNMLNFDSAYDQYLLVSKNVNSAQGAESKYWVCQILFDKALYEKAETEVFDFAKKGTPHQYWLARSFIVLSDIYIIRKETFQAKQYLESVKENYKGKDDVLDMVNMRLEKINQLQPKPKPKADFSVE